MLKSKGLCSDGLLTGKVGMGRPNKLASWQDGDLPFDSKPDACFKSTIVQT
jgi:hypothetical protein